MARANLVFVCTGDAGRIGEDHLPQWTTGEGHSSVIDAEEYRKAIRTFTTGVTVVTIPYDDGVHGMTASSFASVSLSPQLVSINIAKDACAHRHIMRAERFGINLLLESQHATADYFAGRSGPRVEVPFRWEFGCPVLETSLGHFACLKWATYDGGDHTIVVGEVLHVERTDERPLVCSRGRFHHLGPLSSSPAKEPQSWTQTASSR